MQTINKEQILLILKKAWELTSTKPLLKKDIEKFTKTDWEFTALEIEELLKVYGLKITGESIVGLLEKNISNRNTAIYILAIFILKKEDDLSSLELIKLDNFKISKHYFLNKLLLKLNANTNIQSQSDSLNFAENDPNNDVNRKRNYEVIFKYILSFILIFVFIILMIPKNISLKNDNIKLSFTFPKGKAIPATVLFQYDISSYSYDSAYFDYGDGKKVKLLTNKGVFRHTYTAPRELTPILYVDNLKKEFPMIIPSDGWFAIAGSGKKLHYYKKNEENINGVLHLSPNKVPANVLDAEGHYLTAFINISDFDFDCDNLEFETMVKNPIEEGGIRCFDIGIDLVGVHNGKKGVISFNILEPTCTEYSRIKIGDTEIGYNSPITNPKPPLKGFDTSKWIKIKFTTKNKVLNIYANGELLYTLPYTGYVGKLKFIQIAFLGSGSVDWVQIKNTEGKILLKSDF